MSHSCLTIPRLTVGRSYILKSIHHIPHNVSAWNYLRGFLKHFSLPLAPLLPAILPYTAYQPNPDTEINDAFHLPMPSDPLPQDTPLPIPLALEYLADTFIEQNRVDDAAEVFEKLSSKYDRMRAGYWEFRRRECAEE